MNRKPTWSLVLLSITAAQALGQEQTFELVGPSGPGLLGGGACSVGDWTGDGFEDYLIAAPEDGGNLSGTLQIFEGPLSSVPGQGFTPYYGSTAERAGASCCAVEDLDGDGRHELLVGLPGLFNTGFGFNGSARLFLSEAGPNLTFQNSQRFTPPAVSGTFKNAGFAVADLLDLNGDGKSEIALGTPDFGPNDRGEVSIFEADGSGVFPWRILLGAPQARNFGWSVQTVGDLNGDGVPEHAVGAPAVIVSTPIPGRVEVFDGASGARLSSLQAPAGQAGDEFGYALEILGDLTGDGVAELAIGAPGQGVAGRVHVYSGSGLLTGAAPLATLAGEDTYGPAGLSASNDRFGAAIALLDDLNGDNVADFAVGAPNARPFDPFESPTPGIAWPQAFASSVNTGGVRLVSGASLTILRDVFPRTAGGGYPTTPGGFGATIAGPVRPSAGVEPHFVVGAPEQSGLSGHAHGYGGFSLGLPIPAAPGHPLSSNGVLPEITAGGEAAFALNAVEVSLTGLSSVEWGVVFTSAALAATPVPQPGICNSFSYLQQPQFALQLFLTDPSGAANLTLDLSQVPPGVLGARSRLGLQAQYRESTGACPGTLSNLTTGYVVGLY